MQAGIDFYSSDAGKRLLEKLPTVLREANESGGQLVQQKLAAYSEELQRKLETFEAEMHRPKSGDKASAAIRSKTTDAPSK